MKLLPHKAPPLGSGMMDPVKVSPRQRGLVKKLVAACHTRLGVCWGHKNLGARMPSPWSAAGPRSTVNIMPLP